METQSDVHWGDYIRGLGIVLQRQRIACGMSQEALAHRAGITRTHYQQLEKGSWSGTKPANPSLKVLVRLAGALNVTPASLLEGLPTVSSEGFDS